MAPSPPSSSHHNGSPNDGSGLNRSPSTTRRQAYHLPTRVISPPPQTPPQQDWIQAPPAVTLTPPPHLIPLPRSAGNTPRSNAGRDHVNQNAPFTASRSRYSDGRSAIQRITPPMYEMNDFTVKANEFPLPPSSAGSRSPRSLPSQSNGQFLSPTSPHEYGNNRSTPPPSASYQPRYLAQSNQSHSPTQDIRVNSPNYQPPSTSSSNKATFPKPLYLPSSDYDSNQNSMQDVPHSSPQLALPMKSYSPALPTGTVTNPNSASRLLPSPMPYNGTTTDSNPFQEVKIPQQQYASAFSPPDTAATDATFPPPISPNDSLDSNEKRKKKDNKKKPAGPPPLYKPTVRLLFSYSTRREKLTLLLPATILSIGAGIMPPIMTFVLGDAFDLFAVYQTALSYQSTLPPSLRDMVQANADLKSGMITVAIKLILLGVFIVILTTSSLALWIVHGEKVAKRIRYAVYIGVSKKPMAWFDLGMGGRPGQDMGSGNDGDGETALNESSGGLMGRYST